MFGRKEERLSRKEAHVAHNSQLFRPLQRPVPAYLKQGRDMDIIYGDLLKFIAPKECVCICGEIWLQALAFVIFE
jgi:hypothetical protein